MREITCIVLNGGTVHGAQEVDAAALRAVETVHGVAKDVPRDKLTLATAVLSCDEERSGGVICCHAPGSQHARWPPVRQSDICAER